MTHSVVLVKILGTKKVFVTARKNEVFNKMNKSPEQQWFDIHDVDYDSERNKKSPQAEAVLKAGAHGIDITILRTDMPKTDAESEKKRLISVFDGAGLTVLNQQ